MVDCLVPGYWSRANNDAERRPGRSVLRIDCLTMKLLVSKALGSDKSTSRFGP